MKQIIFILILALVGLRGAGQDTIHYVKIGTEYNEVGVQIERLSDSTFLVLANSGNDLNQNNSSIELLQVALDGSVLNALSLGTIKSDRANQFMVSGQSVVISGISNGYSEIYEGSIWFLNLDGSRFQEHHESINGLWSEYSVMLNRDDTVFAVLEAMNSSETNPKIKKFNLNGDFLNDVALNQMNGYHFQQLISSFDGGFLGVGSILTDSSDAFIIKFDSKFEIEWEKVLSTSGNDVFVGVAQLSDSNIVVAGNSDGIFYDDIDIMVFKLTDNGDFLDTLYQGFDSSVVNRDDLVHSLDVLNDTVYLTGMTKTYGNGGAEVFMSRLDSDLNPVLGSSTFGTTADEESYDILPLNSGVVGVGYTKFNTLGGNDILFWNRNSFTNDTTVIIINTQQYTIDTVITNIKRVEHNLEIEIIQNNNRITCSIPEGLKADLQVFDVQGRLIKQINKASYIDFSIATTGLYIIRMKVASNIVTRKVVIF